jgi:hypothetical protein
MSDPGERIDLPSGASLYYVDADHSYWRCKEDGSRGRRLTGVTTVCKTLDYDPSKLLGWAAKTQCIGVAERYAEGGDLDWLASQESIWRELESHQLTFEHVRDKAASEGTNVHERALQALALGRPVPDLDSLSDRERGLAKAVVAFWLDHDPKAELVEQIVYSERLGVAGRLDFLGTLSTREGRGVIDLKTGRWISAAAHAQVGGGYPLLAEESGYGEVNWALILQVREDGTYELIPAQGTSEGFQSAVATYREAGRINREASKARKQMAVAA